MRLNGFNLPVSACQPMASAPGKTSPGNNANATGQASPAGAVSVPSMTASQGLNQNTLGRQSQGMGASGADASDLNAQVNMLLGFVSLLFSQLLGQQGQPAAQQAGSMGLGNVGAASGNPFTSVGTANASSKKLAVLDDANTGHGQSVMDVTGQALRQNGVAGVQPLFVQQGVQNLPYQNLESAIDGLLSGALNQRSSEIAKLAQSGQVGVINLSNGLSPVDMMDQLTGLAKSDAAVMNDMKASLGLSDQSSWADFHQAMGNYISSRMKTSEAYKQAVGNYRQATRQAEAQGVAVVVAAGNSQDEMTLLRNAGVSLDDELGMNLLSNSNHVITVGATNDNGTQNTQDDTPADFSSAGDRVRFAANGVNVFGNQRYQGTSYSAPQVSGLIASLQAENPNLSVSQIKSILAQTAVKSDAIDAKQEGAGTVQWGAALSLGRQRVA